MPADLLNLWQFFDNHDAFAEFQHRVEAVLAEKALALREEAAPAPITDRWQARQRWALDILARGVHSLRSEAIAMIPALAVKANTAGLISAEGILTATDAQIRATIDDDFVDVYAGYVPPAVS